MAGLSRIQAGGLAAVGALVALLGVALYSARDGSPVGVAPAAPAQSPPAPQAEAPPKGTLTGSLPDMSGGGTVSATVEEIMLTPQARILAERFKCVCGCGDILATCNCKETPGSRDMKQYLQQLVSEGKSPVEVESAMVARYGEAVRP